MLNVYALPFGSASAGIEPTESHACVFRFGTKPYPFDCSDWPCEAADRLTESVATDAKTQKFIEMLK
jgi:hypothetical protein